MPSVTLKTSGFLRQVKVDQSEWGGRERKTRKRSRPTLAGAELVCSAPRGV